MSVESGKTSEAGSVLGFAPTQRTVGFPVSSEPNSETAAATPSTTPSTAPRPPGVRGAPTPKRAKGRWFISFVLFTVAATVLTGLFNDFFRYTAYGVIDGRVLRISAPWSGVVTSMHVRDGEYVTQGQLLATLENPELRLRLAALRDRVQIAHANLQVRLAEVRVTQEQQSERDLRLYVDYFDLLGSLQEETVQLYDLQSVYRRQQKLAAGEATSPQQLETAERSFRSKKARVEELQRAVAEMKPAIESAEATSDVSGLLSAEKASMETLVNEWQRVTEYANLGEIRAPVAGRIVRRHHFTGEYAGEASVVFELLEEGSLGAVLYLSQQQAKQFGVGDTLQLDVPGHGERLAFGIDRFGDTMSVAPDGLRRFYSSNQRLVEVFAKPKLPQLRDTQGDRSAWLGAEVRLPRFNFSTLR